MTNQEILNKVVEAKKSRYISLSKVKDLGKGVVKKSDLVIRLGVKAANMKAFADKVVIDENGNKHLGSLPWGHWVAGLENLVIEHKGNYYLRVANAYTENNKSIYLLDGKEITKEEALNIVGEKKLISKPADVYNIKFENLISIGNN